MHGGVSTHWCLRSIREGAGWSCQAPLSLGTTGIPLSSLASHLAGMDLLACHPAREPTPPGSQGDLISSSSHATFSGFLTSCLCVPRALGVNVSAVGTELATHCPLAMVPTQDGHL